MEIMEMIKKINDEMKRRDEMKRKLAIRYTEKALGKNETGSFYAWFGEIPGLIPSAEWRKIRYYEREEIKKWLQEEKKKFPEITETENIESLEKSIEKLEEKIDVEIYELTKKRKRFTVLLEIEDKIIPKDLLIYGVIFGFIRTNKGDVPVSSIREIRDGGRLIGKYAVGRKKDTSYRETYSGEFPRGWKTEGIIKKYNRKTRKYLIEGTNYIFNETGTYQINGSGDWYFRYQIELGEDQ